MTRTAAIVAAAALWLAVPAHADLRGHGGPVRALAVAPDGRTAISGSFDQSAILWSLERETALDVLRFHDGAVNAAAALPDGRFATGGEDGRIAIWARGQTRPVRVIGGHSAPVAGLAVSADGRQIASAAWDETVRVTPLGEGREIALTGHQGNVNGVGFAPDGKAVVSAGYDATLRIWLLDGARPPVVRRFPTALHGVVVGPDGQIVTGGGDGHIYVTSAAGEIVHDVAALPTPITSLALSRDGMLIAASAIGGKIVILDRASAKVVREIDSRAPVWSLAFTPDGKLLSGGGDRLVRRWDAATGAPLGAGAVVAEAAPAAALDEHGARVFRACTACHTVTADGGNRAGPTLHKLFGRRIATAPGYNYSDALKRMDIVWSPETVSKLFEVGPNSYTPGTKMPEQRIGDPEDRAALVRFLEKATR